MKTILQATLSNINIGPADDAHRWRALHAEALGIPKEKASSMSIAEQLKAHSDHMESVWAALDKGDAGPLCAIQNEAGRRATAQALVNEQVSKGVSYDAAFNMIRLSRPDLIPSTPTPRKS